MTWRQHMKTIDSGLSPVVPVPLPGSKWQDRPKESLETLDDMNRYHLLRRSCIQSTFASSSFF